MSRLIWRLIRPYRATLVVIFLAMLVQTTMSVAAPWPLKVVVDNVVGDHKLPHLVDKLLRPFLSGGDRMTLAAVAAVATVLVALLGAVASYIANYYTTSVGQWVANDLRLRTYHHLQ
jgi:ABC-type multidrug transport system fused ATPase/permease subunit